LDGTSCAVTSHYGAGKPMGSVAIGPLALMGHSVGATVSPLALAADPAHLYQAAIFSGSGGSWISNVLYKQLPRQGLPFSSSNNMDMRGVMESGMLLREKIEGETNPAISLLQWVGEPADAPVYNRLSADLLSAHQQTVLTLQGIVDHY